MNDTVQLLVIPENEWKLLMDRQLQILDRLGQLKVANPPADQLSYLTAIAFMKKVSIGRTKFDQLVQTGQIKIIKKGRKIYVPAGEVIKYFT